MQGNLRTVRLGALIQKEISALLHNGLKNPNVGLASISHVDVTPDLSYATVKISVMGSKQEQMKSLNALQQSAGFIRSHLAKLINIHRFPELRFVFDEGQQHAARIDEILHELKEKGEL
ncbi:MAG: 30S ribosome-binding factor RbfA [Candidatus Fibromonas sp.]|jgi:ribosome-binding factor A|nr:30S ribosome-binding factor RbfA [Candidatus Fibromonas sp.]